MGDNPDERIAELEHELAQQKRIAELERQVAAAKAAANQESAGAPIAGLSALDAQSRRQVESILEGLRGVGPAAPQMRAALAQAAAQAGMSQEQLDNALQHGGVTVQKSHSVVYPSQPVVYQNQDIPQRQYIPANFATGPNRRTRFGLRVRDGKLHTGDLLGAIGGLIGLCLGGAAAIIAILPWSASWTSPIVCRSPFHLAYSTSHYSYKPGQSGTSVNFACVNNDAYYSANYLMIGGLQALAIALIIGIPLLVAFWAWRRSQKSSGFEGRV